LDNLGEKEALVSVWLGGRVENFVVGPRCFLPGPTKKFSP